MPQFDQIDSFAGQIFWLIVFFGLLYLTMARIILPRIGDTLEKRAHKIDEDLAAARVDRDKAADLLAEVERQLSAAREEARQQVLSATQEAENQLKAKVDKLDKELAQETAEAIKRIEEARTAARKDLVAASKDLTGEIVMQITGKRPSAAVLTEVYKGRSASVN